MFLKDRLECGHGLMEVHDLPRVARGLKLLVEPLQLLAGWIRAVQCDEANIRCWTERVVELSAHVEEFVVALIPGIFFPQRREEFHSVIDQWLVRRLEL